jgi:hypothetical protein
VPDPAHIPREPLLQGDGVRVEPHQDHPRFGRKTTVARFTNRR